MSVFMEELKESYGEQWLMPYTYNMADAVCIYALAIERQLRENKWTGLVQDWESFQQSLGKTNFKGFMGEVKYVLQDSKQKRYAESGEKDLEGPDLFFTQTLDQWTSVDKVSLADMELQENGADVKIFWHEGKRVHSCLFDPGRRLGQARGPNF